MLKEKRLGGKGDAFFLSFYFVHLFSANVDRFHPFPAKGITRTRKTSKQKNCREKNLQNCWRKKVSFGFIFGMSLRVFFAIPAHTARERAIGARRNIFSISRTCTLSVMPLQHFFLVFCFVNGQRKNRKIIFRSSRAPAHNRVVIRV